MTSEIFIGVYYVSPDAPKLEKITQGDWIDLYADEDVVLKAGDSALLSLGVVIKLPRNYEAHLAPRSSTFKNYGVIQTNGVGIIDESYCGPNDVWKMPILAMRPTEIKRGSKIAQFRIMKKMSDVTFWTLSEPIGSDRGGFGSTGA